MRMSDKQREDIKLAAKLIVEEMAENHINLMNNQVDIPSYSDKEEPQIFISAIINFLQPTSCEVIHTKTKQLTLRWEF